MLKEEPWEATLLYSQVEKNQRDAPLGYEAKLRNAKLSYYKGEFRLAQEHLDILKQATTRENCNDAMDLSMRIKENTAFRFCWRGFERVRSHRVVVTSE